MQRTFLLLWMMCFILSNALSAKIIEASDLDEVLCYFEDLDSQSLVMWDVDNTLITPNDNILRPSNEAMMRELTLRYIGKTPSENRREFFSYILNRISFRLVDPALPTLISSLQNQAIPVMAFTAMRTGSYGIIPSMENWRIHQLQKLGIDFKNFLPQHSGLNWRQIDSSKGQPAFKAGILCSDLIAKGPVLDSFLQKIDWKPNRIIFFEDLLECLISVEEALEVLEIPFIGIHYRAAQLIKSPVNAEVAHYQYQTLIEKKIWLTDEEALQALQQASGEIQHSDTR